MTIEQLMPKPGNRVVCRLPLAQSPDGRMHAVSEGTAGYVVRLVHSTIEGEPFLDGRMSSTIAHVRWDGDTDICPIGPGLLRVLPTNPTPAIDVEVLQIVEQLKRSLSGNNMRYVIEQLSAELARSPGH